jgi:hypothetical protein
MATGRIPTTANSPLTAKGDLFTFSTGSAKLAVGSNGDTLVADSSTTTGLRYSPTMAAGKNSCINGAFDIWQRGTTFTNPGGGSGTYTADRWTVYFNGNGTVTQETSVKPDTSTYALKVTATASSADNSVYQLVEQLNMEQFRGKTVTLSVKVAGTATLTPSIALAYSTTADTALTTTNTAITATVVSNPTINASTFVTYISQFTVPNTAKTLRIQLGSGTMANTNVLYWAEAQLEIGSVATVFSRAGGTIQGELAACQRYYYRATFTTSASRLGSGFATSQTTAHITFPFPTEMRIRPTALEQSGTAGDYSIVSGSSTSVCDNVPTFVNATFYAAVASFPVPAASLTLGNGAGLRNVNTNAYLGWSSEL